MRQHLARDVCSKHPRRLFHLVCCPVLARMRARHRRAKIVRQRHFVICAFDETLRSGLTINVVTPASFTPKSKFPVVVVRDRNVPRK